MAYKNIEKRRAASRRWNAKHPEQKKAIWRKWYDANKKEILARRDPIKQRKQKLWQVWKITPDEYDSILAKQGGGCAVCGNVPLKPYSFPVDHDHETGKVRGILCGHCNKGLGFFLDNVSLLQKAMKYIGKQ